ncbi:MAG TPA: hypothetical protein DD420_33645 [Streptomyces sp.]|nr:hypothetical protein [Streptomyces sp.]
MDAPARGRAWRVSGGEHDAAQCKPSHGEKVKLGAARPHGVAPMTGHDGRFLRASGRAVRIVEGPVEPAPSPGRSVKARQ